MRKTEKFVADNTGIEEALSFIRDFLSSRRVETGESKRAELMAEEAMVSIIYHSGKAREFQVMSTSLLGSVSLEISCEGEKYAFMQNAKDVPFESDDENENAVQEALSEILLKAYAGDLKYRNQGGKNYIRLQVVKSRQALLFRTVVALLAALILGFVLTKTGNESINAGINRYFLLPVKNMFLNALKTVVAPVVFLSIATSIMHFSSLTEFGKIGAKIVISYLCTSIMAVLVGVGVFFLISPAHQIAYAPVVEASEAAQKPLDAVILDTITGIVPDNIIGPFLQNNMLQLIFMAVIFGAAVGMTGRYSKLLMDFLDSCNETFLKITSLIMAVMPVAIFCSIASLALTLGLDALISVLGMIGTFLLGLLCMLIIYSLMLAVFGRISPIVFFKRYFPTMLQVLALASSNASIPVNMEACDKQLGIDKKVYSFSIPFGATVNMDGTCILLSVFTLFLAGFYGVEMPSVAVISMSIAIVLYSIGAPGAPGGMAVIFAALFSQFGIPQDALSIVICLGPLVGMFLTMTNCMGDVVVTTIVSKSEGLLDEKIISSGK